MSHIVIISGPSGAGKSSVARSLCERYDRTIHLPTDRFLFDFIQMGRIDPMRPESARQNDMVSRAVARAATAYAQGLYAVFIDGVIGPHLLPVYLEELRVAEVPVHLALLLPTLEATLERIVPRAPGSNMPREAHERLYAQFAAYGEFAGITVDNSALTADQTADRIMDACGIGGCLVWSPAQ